MSSLFLGSFRVSPVLFCSSRWKALLPQLAGRKADDSSLFWDETCSQFQSLSLKLLAAITFFSALGWFVSNSREPVCEFTANPVDLSGGPGELEYFWILLLWDNFIFGGLWGWSSSLEQFCGGWLWLDERGFPLAKILVDCMVPMSLFWETPAANLIGPGRDGASSFWNLARSSLKLLIASYNTKRKKKFHYSRRKN